MFSSVSKFKIDTSTNIFHFTNPLLDLHPTDDYVDSSKSSNKFSGDPPIELTQPSSTTSVPSAEVQCENFDVELPFYHLFQISMFIVLPD